MEPEEEFLENASLLINYTKKEINQFISWTVKLKPLTISSENILANLESVAADINKLKKEYKERKNLLNDNNINV
ncbi:hypothetical protein SAMN06265337_4328 [Hymenobacter gelipurpurascens]|uniref:Uncharacterized protein n=1 Tax=Hymenobacter gelipurpurascens TaxID=89968 RepID=A0A212UHR2_9BACT|nr:hypothetical protein [Hymenobacter gelipurpurascens]SNC77726.1 hypothetical protein SAMN06265337_4328 [Hymenobacter gelipurpurascens]